MPNTEVLFRIGAGFLFFLALTMSGYFRQRADQAGGRLPSNFRLVALRLVGLLFALPFLAYLMNPAWVGWARFPAPLQLASAGPALQAASWRSSASTLYQVLRALGDNITPIELTRDANRLVTDGPYRWVRHPLYTIGSSLWICLGIVSTLWPVFVGLAAAWLLLFFRTSLEEKELGDRFGEAYRAYSRRTGRFLPHLWRR